MAARSRPEPISGAPSAAASIARLTSGWGGILAKLWADLDRDNISVIAAGVAFYGLLAIFPGMSALISIYGLIADPAVIEGQVAALSGVLPQEALDALRTRLSAAVEQYTTAGGVELPGLSLVASARVRRR